MLAAQAQDGYWWGELEADTTLESDYILYLHVLGQLKSEKTAKLARYILERQLDDGGWYIFYGGPSELNATVKAYVALRLAGDSANAPRTRSARSKKYWTWAASKPRTPMYDFISRWSAPLVGTWCLRFRPR